MGNESSKNTEQESDESEEIKRQIKEAFADARKDIKVVLAGKSSSGKTTLFKALCGKKAEEPLSAHPTTTKVKDKSRKKNGVTIHIIDTPALGSSREQSQVEGEIDLILYCLPVTPGLRFEDENPEIMKCLQDAYTEEVWKKCVIIFTFSNQVWDRINQSAADQEAKIRQYTEYLTKYAESFRKQLGELKVKDIVMSTIFDEDSVDSDQDHTIMAIPAGKVPSDPVLPGVDMQHAKRSWVDEIFLEMVRNCTKESTLALLRYQMDDLTLQETIHETAAAINNIVTKTADGAGKGASLGRKIGKKAEKTGAIAGAIIGALESRREISQLYDKCNK